MGHAGRRVPRCRHCNAPHGADCILIAISKQPVELAAIALEFGAFIEDLAEHILHDANLVADANFPAKLGLDIGGS